MRDLAKARELPVRLDRELNGLPVGALALLTVLGSVFAMLPGILEVLAFGSATFLAVFALVNHLAARTAETRTARMLAHIGSAACVAAIAALGFELFEHDQPALMLIGFCVLSVVVARRIFIHTRKDPTPT